MNDHMRQLRTVARALRGAAGTAVAWAVGWGVIGLLIGAYRAFSIPTDSILHGPSAWTMAVRWAALGAIGGLAFAIALAVFARRDDVGELSVWRGAGLGAAAVFLLATVPAVLGDGLSELGTTLMIVGILAGLGAASGAATMALAHRGGVRGDSDGPHPVSR